MFSLLLYLFCLPILTSYATESLINGTFSLVFHATFKCTNQRSCNVCNHKTLQCIAYIDDFDLAEVAPRYNNSAPDFVKVKGDAQN